MKIIEQRHTEEPWLLYWLGNATAIDDRCIKSIGIAWLFKEKGKWDFIPRITGQESLFFNAALFVRFLLPLGAFISIRWRSSETAKSMLQMGFGWKLNGRLAILFRIQSDRSSAVGTSGPNIGQASGFEYGTH